MNDTTRRFLTAIVERVPAGSEIVELRLFPSIRQGGVESGVAVVAVEPPEPVADAIDAIAGPGAVGDEGAEGDGTAEMVVAADEEDAGAANASSATDDATAAAAPVDVETYVSEAAHALVDTDVAIEDEEGGSGDESPAPQTFIPMADTADAIEVEDALDDEVQTIVLTVEREYVPAEAMALGETGEEPAGEGEERRAEVVLHVEPGVAADESPYADAPAPSEQTSRPLLADAALADVASSADTADGALAEAIADARARLASPVGGIAMVAEPADLAAPNDEESITLGDILALPSPASGAEAGEASDAGDAVADAAVVAVPAAPPHRLQILTARYRLVIKGPDRGKWDVDVIHEADAPLDTVERVVRGVSKRSGEEQDAQLFTGESLRAALAAPVWATTP